MSKTKQIAVKDLSIDLKNFRTVPQGGETEAIHAMINISPDKFWALTESILDDGYIPTENIIVLQESKDQLTVREGNRRIAILKISLGYIKKDSFPIPSNIAEKISKLTTSWKNSNSSVPCCVYNKNESAIVEKIVNLTHGKGQSASRDTWTSVARARHNRNEVGNPEPALDLLESYIEEGKNITTTQKERWAGDYPLTVLGEALAKIVARTDIESVYELVKKYPKIKFRKQLEDVIHDIGAAKTITFPTMRKQDVLASFGFAEPKEEEEKQQEAAEKTKPSSQNKSTKKSSAYSVTDPKNTKELLKNFSPQGADAQKIVTLKVEASKLNINTTPHAFCFVVRSMLDISAKSYCKSNNIQIKITKKDKQGHEKTKTLTLSEMLKAVHKHLIAKNDDKDFQNVVKGAITELNSKGSFLSVTSMNELIHNPAFSTSSAPLSTSFSNIFPLLKAMNTTQSGN